MLPGELRVPSSRGSPAAAPIPSPTLRQCARLHAPHPSSRRGHEHAADPHARRLPRLPGFLDALLRQGGDSVTETLQNNVDAVNAQGERTGREVLTHVNHPNFGWALSPEDVAAVKGARFFEVYNGHPGVNNHGDEEHPDTGRIWDIALTLRLTELDLGLLYGLATDDAHHYSEWGPGHANPGRGWVMVRARGLDPGGLIRALQAGDFYSSSGVVLEDVRRWGDHIVVEVAAEPGVTYTTRFIGTRRSGEHTGPVGEVLQESTGERAVYRFRGDELYVRAEIVSSRPHPNPHAEGDLERAWVQPVLP